MDQGSTEWFDARCGRVTASRIKDVVSKGAARAAYMHEIIAERMTGQTAHRFTSAAMQWGTDTEPQALASYALETGTEVEAVGFIEHPRFAFAGASPDGLVGEGLVEVKCPNTVTHVATLVAGRMPGEHRWQVQWQMACTGRAWCDFVSFDPRLPSPADLFIVRVDRDETLIAEIEAAVEAFDAEASGHVERIKGVPDAQA